MNSERVQIVDSFRMLRVNGIKPTESFVIYLTISSIAGIRSGPNLPEHQVKCSQSGNSFPEFLDASWIINNCRKLVTGSQSQWCLWIYDLPPVLLSEDLYERQDLLGKALMTSFAEMLDLPPETFAQCFEGGVHTRVWRQWRLECQMKLQDSNHSVWKAHGRCMVQSELDDADAFQFLTSTFCLSAFGISRTGHGHDSLAAISTCRDCGRSSTTTSCQLRD